MGRQVTPCFCCCLSLKPVLLLHTECHNICCRDYSISQGCWLPDAALMSTKHTMWHYAAHQSCSQQHRMPTIPKECRPPANQFPLGRPILPLTCTTTDTQGHRQKRTPPPKQANPKRRSEWPVGAAPSTHDDTGVPHRRPAHPATECSTTRCADCG